MDGNDDANISFIIMFVKFPELRHLSARYRRFSTNVEADTKVLQELLKNGTLKPHSIPLERVNIYHYYFNTEPHLDAFQKTLNRISKFPVHLDIRRCYVPTTTTTTTTSSNGDGDARQQEQQRSLEEAMEGVSISEACYNIVSKEAQCWACLHSFERCWKCESICAACQRTRLPPLANDQKLQDFQRRRRGRRHTQREKNKSMVVSAGANDLAVTITPTTATTNSSVIDDPSLEDEFSVFE
ncbi:hypothetical protein BDB00DRAFT_215320 [Zychaea mexicana]|uniref:uncharacterized protein n=1 Tax=Zychaea mexicana TaxID=64656 RepID=UPI0022FDC7A6|nr:uncharacterized protein BDB00DRAFT_215320 [Zychaea mexicana]KAI9472950.1 hypothetical protein BDB00DRAFT_215320 [Zychaea mexicana]